MEKQKKVAEVQGTELQKTNERETTISITPKMLNAMIENPKIAQIMLKEWEYEIEEGTKNLKGNDLFKRGQAMARQTTLI